MAKVSNFQNKGWMFYCPGCKSHHSIDRRWTFNGDVNKPTFTPSLLCKSVQGVEMKDTICHSFIREGSIEFLSDCTHEFAGKTIDIEDIEF